MRELKSGLFFLALSVLVLWESLRSGLGALTEPGAGVFPLCAGVVLMFLSLALIVRGWGKHDQLPPHSRRVMVTVAVLFAYSLLLSAIGFVIATFLLSTALFQIGESRRWWVQMGMGALLTLLFYLVFVVWLKVYVPQGFLMRYI